MSVKYCFFILTFVSFVFVSKSQTINVTGNPVFPTSGLTLTEAGNNFTTSVTSSIGSYIDISHTSNNLRRSGNFDWRVKIHKSDVKWNSILVIQARRTGNGTANTSRNNEYISGGTNFQNVTNVPVTFFSGGAVRDDIPISYKINNISVLIPADDYETTIYYTIYDV